MGDMADFEIDRLERGQSLVLDIITGIEIVVQNTELMYTTLYDDDDRYHIRDYDPDEDD